MARILRQLAGNLLLTLAGVSLALVIAEFGVRIFEGDPLLPLIPPEPYVDNAVLYQKTPTRRYELRPGVDETVGANLVHIHINADGFRDNIDYPIMKPTGTFRIVVLGDSFTFAGKVALEDTFPKRLEAKLNQSDPSKNYEVLNFAVPGYDSQQEMLMLKERALAYQPDLVILGFVLNDALPMGQLVPGASRIPLAVRQVLKRSYLVQFVYAEYVSFRSRAQTGGFKGDSDVADLAEGKAGWQLAKDALAEMQRLTAQKNAKLLVAIWPMFTSLDDHYPYQAKHELVRLACQALGIPTLDLFPTFKGQQASVLWAAPDDQHPNRLAQQEAADAIYQEIIGEKLIAPTAAP
jgi:lysophospholipase L1-like esterase